MFELILILVWMLPVIPTWRRLAYSLALKIGHRRYLEDCRESSRLWGMIWGFFLAIPWPLTIIGYFILTDRGQWFFLAPGHERRETKLRKQQLELKEKKKAYDNRIEALERAVKVGPYA